MQEHMEINVKILYFFLQLLKLINLICCGLVIGFGGGRVAKNSQVSDIRRGLINDVIRFIN